MDEVKTAAGPLSAAGPGLARLVTTAAIALFVVALLLASYGRVPVGALVLVLMLFEQGVIVAAYLAAAAGWGTLVMRLVREPALDATGIAGRLIVGTGAMALAMWLLGWAGQLNTVTAWGIGTIGWALAAWEVYRVSDAETLQSQQSWPMLPWPVLLGVPAGTLMLAAACIPPGVLWASEHQGYDVLSYHLQLPREWIELGAVQGLTHNVYSYLPSLFEVAFAQLGLWRGSMVDASYTAQLLHAAMALLAAIVIGRLVADRVHAVAGALAGALYLAVPWTVVTGSLAYNEQAVAAFAAVALAVILKLDHPDAEPQPAAEPETTTDDAPIPRPLLPDLRAGAVAGVLVGLAVLSKLTAVGMVALPLAAVLAMNLQGGRRGQIARLGGFALGAGVLVGLFAIRNAAWTGNPLFPMLTGILGEGHWTSEQAQRWNEAHHSPGIFSGLKALGTMAIWHVQFGYIVWPLTIAAAVLGWRHATASRATKLLLVVLAIQLAFWLLLTHHQSRFLLPLLLPAAVLIGLSWPAWRSAATAASVAGLTVVACTVTSFGVYLSEHNGGAPLFIDSLHLLHEPDPHAGLQTPYNTINRHVPPDGRVYAEAFALPFYVQRPISYHTVWDASPLGPYIAEDYFADAHAYLHEQGYTHVVIDWNMLNLWLDDDNYGYDPHIRPDQLQAFAEQALRPVDRVEGLVIYTVRPR